MIRMAFLRRSAVVAALLATFAAASFAQHARVNIPSNKSFDQTVQAFKMGVSKGGMMVMGTVDQGNMLKMTGLNMQGTLFLVGNPNVGKMVFQNDPAAGLYLPLRVYIYQSTSGQTFISYDKPSAVLKQFNNKAIDTTAGMLDKKLDMLTHMVAQ